MDAAPGAGLRRAPGRGRLGGTWRSARRCAGRRLVPIAALVGAQASFGVRSGQRQSEANVDARADVRERIDRSTRATRRHLVARSRSRWPAAVSRCLGLGSLRCRGAARDGVKLAHAAVLAAWEVATDRHGRDEFNLGADGRLVKWTPRLDNGRDMHTIHTWPSPGIPGRPAATFGSTAFTSPMPKECCSIPVH